MDYQQPILDYAAPNARARLKLPTRSVLRVDTASGGRVILTETLKARGYAAWVIAFTLVTLCLQVPGLVDAYEQFRDKAYALTWIAIAAGLALAALILIPFVINNTWRVTRLTAQTETLKLEFVAPFGRKEYRWEATEIRDMRIIASVEHAHGEMQIMPDGYPSVHLFTGHHALELRKCLEALWPELWPGTQPAPLIPGDA